MDAANVGEVILFDVIALRAGTALVLGVLVGLDREIKRKPLGARLCADRAGVGLFYDGDFEFRAWADSAGARH